MDCLEFKLIRSYLVFYQILWNKHFQTFEYKKKIYIIFFSHVPPKTRIFFFWFHSLFYLFYLSLLFQYIESQFLQYRSKYRNFLQISSERKEPWNKILFGLYSTVNESAHGIQNFSKKKMKKNMLGIYLPWFVKRIAFFFLW